MGWLARYLSSLWGVMTRLTRFSLVGFKTFLLISLVAITLAGLSVANANPSQTQLSKIVDIYDGGNLRSVPTRAETVGQLLERLGISLDPDDIVEPSLESSLDQPDFQVSIYRARSLRIIDGQETRTVRSAYQNPRLIVDNAGYHLASNDDAVWVQTPSLTNPSLPLDTIEIIRSVTTETRIVPLPPQVILTIDNSLPSCYFRVVSLGQAGSKEVTYQSSLAGSSAGATPVVSEVVITEAIDEQRVQGGQRAHFIAEADRQALAASAGVTTSDWTYLNYIFTKESRWNAAACNPSSKAFGLCQALPASKMADIAGDYWTNPLTQMKWCHQYALGRYGSWQNAYNFWQANYWW